MESWFFVFILILGLLRDDGKGNLYNSSFSTVIFYRKIRQLVEA